MVRSRFPAGIAVGLLVILLTWVAWQVVGNWQVRAGLSWARGQIEAERYAPARDRLAQLSALWPRHDEVAYLLGVCEAELGRPQEAVAAWEQVSASSPLGALTAITEGRTLVYSLGRSQEAAGPVCIATRRAAAWALKGHPRRSLGARRAAALGGATGRVSPAAPGDRTRRDAPRPDCRTPRTVAARLGGRRGRGIPADHHTGRADRAARQPGLARARAPRHAIRPLPRSTSPAWTQCNPEASRIDPSRLPRRTWNGQLAAGEPESEAARCRGSPADRICASEPPSLRAWFAARRNDPAAERSALEQLIAVEPGNTAALDPPGDAARQAGRSDRGRRGTPPADQEEAHTGQGALPADS